MINRLKPNELTHICDRVLFDINTTDDLKGHFNSIIGQERALNALNFGLGIDSKGFNIYALGDGGTGKTTAIKKLLADKARLKPVPPDWCYVYNFKNPDAPMAISLPAGNVREFKKDIEDLVKGLTTEIPKVFESKDYEKSRAKLIENFQKRQNELFEGIENEAKEKSFSIRKRQTSLIIVPVKPDGEPLTEEEYAALSDDTKRVIEQTGRALQEKLDDVVRMVRDEEKRLKDSISQLDKEMVINTTGHLFDRLQHKYNDNEKVVFYLKEIMDDVVAHLDDFKPTEEQPSPFPFFKPPKQEANLQKYSVNIIVDNSDLEGAPVVFEHNPTFLNICGRIEYRFQYGMAITDFTMIKGGALHKANGGYLIVNILDVLKNIFSYDALKRAIKHREIKIEDAWEQYRLVSTSSLRPEGIPLNVKVILIGSVYLYYLLYNLDDEFRELFKIKADFDSTMVRDDETVKLYAAFAASCQNTEGLKPIDRDGLCLIVETGSRIANHKRRLTTRFSDLADLIREANYWANSEGSQIIRRSHIQKAIDEKIYRCNRIETKIQELIDEGTIIIETESVKVGQVNGIAVLDLGDYMFGKPSRITAQTYAGKGGVVNIERETKMSGRIHNKAVMILTSYLNSKFSVKKPANLSAHLAFEQLYDMIEGDSATCAEFYAIISSLSKVPLKQSIAVTGSMDQMGLVQPVGGINEKIEGFFAVCKHRGLDGSHGVIIPSRNIQNLMLKTEVIDAVEKGLFTIYAIDSVEDGLEILTGMVAGEMDEKGDFSDGSIYYLVKKRLEQFSISEKDDNKKEGDPDGRLDDADQKSH
ncbi:MAG: AAA family ATPase [Thermodesulfovibrionales bacterium]|nr:AAA family ATPase [Thermodesulfovibrionales bacterium]